MSKCERQAWPVDHPCTDIVLPKIQMLSQVEHLKLVQFYGYVEYEDEKVVVVEFVPNVTLRQHLDCMQGDILDLVARLDIAIDVAHAVTYLHMYTVELVIEPKRELKERITAKWVRILSYLPILGHTLVFSISKISTMKSAADNLAVEKILELSLQCLAQSRQHRPSMKRCAEILWSIRKDYEEMLAPDSHLPPVWKGGLQPEKSNNIIRAFK